MNYSFKDKSEEYWSDCKYDKLKFGPDKVNLCPLSVSKGEKMGGLWVCR